MSEYSGPERVSPSSLISGAQKSFSRMSSEADISMAEASAPAWHHSLLGQLKAAGKVRGEEFSEETVTRRDHQRLQPVRLKRYIRGARVRHVESGKKFTIIQANAGHTKKSRITVHKCADKDGNVCLVPETKLDLR